MHSVKRGSRLLGLFGALGLAFVLGACGGGGMSAGGGEALPPPLDPLAVTVHEAVSDDEGRLAFPDAPGGQLEVRLVDDLTGDPLPGRYGRLTTDGTRTLLATLAGATVQWSVVDGAGAGRTAKLLPVQQRSAEEPVCSGGAAFKAAGDLVARMRLTDSKVLAVGVLRDDIAATLLSAFTEDVIEGVAINLLVPDAPPPFDQILDVISLGGHAVRGLHDACSALMVARFPPTQRFDIVATTILPFTPLEATWVSVIPLNEAPDVAGGADLQVEGLTLQASPVAAGGRLGIDFAVHNRGTGASEPTTVEVVLEASPGSEETHLTSLSLPRLPPDGRFVVSHLVRIPAGTPPGERQLSVKVGGDAAYAPVRVEALRATGYSISPSTPRLGERDGAIVFTVTRSGPLPAETVHVSTAQTEGFVNGSDYAGLADLELTFSIDQVSATVAVTLLDDTRVEGDERFALLVQRSPTDPTLTHLARATFTITDDDTSAAGYSIAPGTTSVGEGAGSVVFTVTRSGAFPAETVYASTVQNEGSSNSGDYLGKVDTAVGFSSGQVSASISVSILDDATSESDERFALIVQRSATDSTSTYIARAVFTIRDDDAAATTYAISPGSTSVKENAGSITFTVTRSGSRPAETVYVSTAQTEGHTNSSDYVGKLNEALTFTSGQVSASVVVTITNGTSSEGDEKFGLIVQRNKSDPTSTYLAKATFTIQDDDTSYAISPGSTSVNEGSGSVTFTVTRSGALPSETVYVSTLQSEGYTNSSDYTGKLNEKLSFSSGQTKKTITVSITNNATAEPNEKFALIVQRSSSDATSVYLVRATFTILNDD